ncbi:outer membrane beta-barrel protein [Fulvivirga kasyanovii]|nr:outer membrane beta-barrel protein [Fulvivirga kasyanovii]
MQDKTQFEKEWENAFADAEMDVSTSVWEKVELGVSQASAGKYKRRLLLFQLLAAASVAFAMTVGGVAVYHLQVNDLGSEDSSIAINDTESKERGHTENNAQANEDSKPDKNDGVSSESETLRSNYSDSYVGGDSKEAEGSRDAVSKSTGHEANDVEGAEKSGAGNNLANSGSGVSIDRLDQTDRTTANTDYTMPNNDGGSNNVGDATNVNKANGNTMALAGKKESDENAYSKGEGIIDRKLLDNVEHESRVASSQTGNGLNSADGGKLPEEIERLFEYLETTPLEERELNMVPWYSYVPNKKQGNSDGLWAGVGFSAGSFDPNMGGGGAAADMDMMETSKLNAASKRAPSFGKERSGQAYNVGVNFGTRLSEKWVLQSGIVYAQQQTTSTSNVVNTSDRQTVKTLSNFADMENAEDIAFTAPYDVNNTYELVSVPIQAGYVLLDSRFNIVILSGVANNILLKNQISASSGDIEDVNISGDDSQYRTYQLTGLLGSEFSYDFGEHYRLALIPQVRQSINSITKSDAEYTSRPTTLEIGFRFKYVFSN